MRKFQELQFIEIIFLRVNYFELFSVFGYFIKDLNFVELGREREKGKRSLIGWLYVYFGQEEGGIV